MISTAHPQGFPRDIHILSGIDRKNGYVLRFFALFRFIRNRKLIPYNRLFTYLICLHSKLNCDWKHGDTFQNTYLGMIEM